MGSCPEGTTVTPFPAPSRPWVSPSPPPTSLTREDTEGDGVPSPQPRGEGNPALRGGQIDGCSWKRCGPGPGAAAGGPPGTGWVTPVTCRHPPAPSLGSRPRRAHPVQEGAEENAHSSQMVKHTSHVPSLVGFHPARAHATPSFLPGAGHGVQGRAEAPWERGVDSALPQTGPVALSQPGCQARPRGISSPAPVSALPGPRTLCSAHRGKNARAMCQQTDHSQVQLRILHPSRDSQAWTPSPSVGPPSRSLPLSAAGLSLRGAGLREKRGPSLLTASATRS